MSGNILLLSGSPRKNGNTERLTRRFSSKSAFTAASASSLDNPPVMAALMQSAFVAISTPNQPADADADADADKREDHAKESKGVRPMSIHGHFLL